MSIGCSPHTVGPPADDLQRPPLPSASTAHAFAASMPYLSPPTPPWLAEAQRACHLIRQEYLSEKKRRRHLRTILDAVDGYLSWVLSAHGGVGPLGPVLECALEHGAAEDRLALARRLKGWYAAMVQRREHKMLVLQLLELCPPARPLVFRELMRYGVLPLLLNFEAIGIVLAAFDHHADDTERALLVRSLHGRVACELADAAARRADADDEKWHAAGLSEVLRECRNPGQVYVILGAARSNIHAVFRNPNPAIPSSAIFHRALLEYLHALDTLPKAVAETFRRDVIQGCLHHVQLLDTTPDGSSVIAQMNAVLQQTESTDIVPLPIAIAMPLPPPFPTPHLDNSTVSLSS